MPKFLEHLKEENPRFVCYPAGGKKASDETFAVFHSLNEASTEAGLRRLKSKLSGDFAQILNLYACHNGMSLYCDKDMPSIEFYKIEDMDERNEDWKEWFDMFDEDELEDELYEFQREGYAFGEICSSGNYFVWHQGKVYYSSHDGGGGEPIAESFDEFLEVIIIQPAQFLYDMGCYTRFSDGKTDIQWIPREYVSGRLP